MRVCSLRRLPGSNWAKAMRDIRSPPKTACGIQARRGRELLARLELHEGGHHARGPDVDGEAVLVERGVARLHREHLAPERGHRHLAVALAQRRGQGLEHRGRDVLDRAPGRGEQGLQVGGLEMLVLGQGHLDRALADARVDRDRRGRARGALAPQDLKGRVVERRRDLHGDRLGDRPLAGEPVALAHEGVAELQLVHDGGRRRGARDQLDPAGGAAAPAAADRVDVHAARVGRLEDGRARFGIEDARAGQDGQRDRHAGAGYHSFS